MLFSFCAPVAFGENPRWVYAVVVGRVAVLHAVSHVAGTASAVCLRRFFGR